MRIPDFHKEYEDNLFVKGMVGIVTIIPDMIKSTSESINALGEMMQSLEEKMVAPIEEEVATT